MTVPILTRKSKTWQKMLAREKHSSLLIRSVSGKEERFYTPAPREGVVEMAILKIALNAFIFFQVDQLEHGLNDKMIPIAIKHKLYLTYRYFNSIYVHPVLSHT